MSIGVKNISEVVKKYGVNGILKGDLLFTYLTENMDFILDENKIKAIELFLDYMKKLPYTNF